jgi:kynureninase
MQNGHGSVLTANHLSRLDSEDPTSHFRDRFVLPGEGVYLDGDGNNYFGTDIACCTPGSTVAQNTDSS